jgi:subtilisin family serine protease
MTTTGRTARLIAVSFAALVALAIAAPVAGAQQPKRHTAAHIRWYRWHPSARTLATREARFREKAMIGLASMDDLKSLRVDYGLTRVRRIAALHAVEVRVSHAQVHALLKRAPSDPRIRYVSPVRRKLETLSVPNDPYLSEVDGLTDLDYEWPFFATHVDRALDVTNGDPHVVVGIIDTGVAYVPDLAGKIDSLWTVSGTSVSQVFSSNDDFGHGTAVASLIAANANDGIGMAGFGGETHVIGVHAGSQGFFVDASVAVALTKLVSLGARIVNMSLGGRIPSDPILVDAIHLAAAQNVLLVASAGNDGSYVGWPAADLQPSGGGRSYGLAVGASTADGTRADFSDWGRKLSLVAPGTYGNRYQGVLVALPQANLFDSMGFLTWADDDGNRYGYIPGTSFAAPEVAGVAALIWAARPDLTNYQVADILKQSAQRTSPDWTPALGCGILDAGAALELATSRPASAWAETPNTSGAVCSADGNAPATWPTEQSQTITFDKLPDRRVGDRAFRITATASSGLPVSFVAYGSCRLAGVSTIHLLGRGICTVIASQSGDDEYEVAAPVTQSFHVAKARPKRRKV